MVSGMESGMEFSRRQLLAAGAVLTVLTACSRPSGQTPVLLVDSPAPLPVEDQFAALEDRYNAKVGFYGRHLGSNRTLGYRADDLFATCSTFKAYVAAAILQKVQQGELKLTNEVFIDPAMLVPVASPITEPGVGGWMPLSDLCAAAVRQSDNTATNLMLEILGGPQSVTDFARSVGDERTWMVRWEPELNSALPGDPRDTTTPRAMGSGFLNMLTGELLDEPNRAQLNEWMSTIVTGDTRIRAGLPPGWGIADKTGAGDFASTNDIGVASGPNGERLVLSVMTRTRSDDPDTTRSEALIADVTRTAVPWLLA
jgi:beta-lactamase class A